MYVCLCNAVTERDVLEAIEAGATSVEEIAHCTGAGSRCGSCRRTVAAMVEAATAPQPGCRVELAGGAVRLRVLTSAA